MGKVMVGVGWLEVGSVFARMVHPQIGFFFSYSPLVDYAPTDYLLTVTCMILFLGNS